MRCFLLSFVFALLWSPVFAQHLPLSVISPTEDPQVRFKNLDTHNGLSSNTITSLLQDNKGYIWIGTTDGLNKYDGRKFKVYRKNPFDTTGLTSGYITCLLKDLKGKIYVGTDKGFYIYIPKKDLFEPLDLHIENHTGKRPYVRAAILIDGDIWIDTNKGILLKYNTKTGKSHFVVKHKNPNQPYYRYHSLFLDSKKNLWIAGRSMAPYYYNLNSEKGHKLRVFEPDLIKGETKYFKRNDATDYYEDEKQNIFILGTDGIFYYDFDNDTIIFQRSGTTYEMMSDKAGNLWFATANGLIFYEKSSGKSYLYKHQKHNKVSLASNYVFKILEDNFGNLWLGTDNGISILKKRNNSIKSFVEIPGIENSPGGQSVSAVAEDKDGNLWIGYEEDGLDYFNRKKKTFLHIKKNNKKSLADNHISCLYIDKDDDLYIGLWSGAGFQIYNTKTETFNLYRKNKKNRTEDWYTDFAEDNTGKMFIGFWGADGLAGFDKKSGRFTAFYEEKFERLNESRLITRIFKNNDGTFWIGTTEGGLHRFFPKHDTAISYFSDDDNARGLFSNKINDITSDLDGNIWIAGEALQKYIPSKDTFIIYGKKNLPDNLVSIIADSSGNIWCASKMHGLFVLNAKTGKIKNLNSKGELLTDYFTKARAYMKDGKLFFGTKSGFHIISPESINTNIKLPEPFFGAFYVNNILKYFEKTIPERIILKPDEKIFWMEVNCSDMAQAGNYIYQYKLDGYDETWVDLNTKDRTIRYSNLQSGDYKLTVRLGDNNGNWSAHTASIPITVLSPFYKRWWFILMILLSAASIFVYIVYQRENEFKLRYANLEIQQQLFRVQMNPHFLYNAMASIQNYLFKSETKMAVNYLSSFGRLFRNVLDNSKEEFIQMEKELETLRLYLYLQQLRFPGEFSYVFNIDEELETDLVLIPPMLAQPIIENALEHGIFPKKGKGHITIDFTKFKSYIELKIQDNGLGFYHKKQEQKNHKSSALQITKSRLRLLEKKYKYKSSFEIKELKDDKGKVKGTVVKFYLPLIYVNNILKNEHKNFDS